MEKHSRCAGSRPGPSVPPLAGIRAKASAIRKSNSRSTQQGWLASVDARTKLACLAAYVMLVLHSRSFTAMTACVAAALLVGVVARLRLRDVRAVLVPLAPVLAITAIMQVLYLQTGRVLVQLGSVAVTADALLAAVRMVVGLACVMVASVAFMRVTTAEQLVTLFRWLLRPLRAFGVRTESVMLALSVAFRFAPVLLADFRQLKSAQASRSACFEGDVLQRLAAYTRLFAPLVRGSFRRADRLAEAFLARCFGNGCEPTSLHLGHFASRDATLLAGAAVFAVAVVLLP